MAMQIGDAVLKFVGDTSELDAAFQQVQEGSAAALAPVRENVAAVSTALDGMAESAQAAGAAMQQAGEQGTQAASTLSEAQTNVARLTYENQVAQSALSKAMRQVHATSGDVTSIIETLGQAQARAAGTAQALAAAQMEVRASATVMGTAMVEAGAVTAFSMGEAKGEIALLSEEIGVKIPRHLRGFIADLPGVGAALNAVFGATAVLMIGQLFIEGGKKLYEFVMASIDAAAKITETWGRATGAIAKHNDELQVAIDKQENEIAKLERKPVNNLKLALDEGIVSADKLAESLAKDSDAVDKLIKENHVGALEDMIGSLFGGSVDTGEQEGLINKVKKDLKDVGEQAQANAKAATTDAEKTDAANKNKILMQTAYTKALKETGDALAEIAAASGGSEFNAKALAAPKAMLEQYFGMVKELQKTFNEQSKLDDDAAHKAKDEGQKKSGKESVATVKEIGDATLAAEKKTLDADADLKVANAKLLLAQGEITLSEEAKQEHDAAEAKYNAALGNQQKLLALYQKDPAKNAARIIAVNAEIDAIEKEHEAKHLKAETDALEALKEARLASDKWLEEHAKASTTLTIKVPDVKPMLSALQLVENAYKTLGMTGSSMYDKMAVDAHKAYTEVAAAARQGVAHQMDAMVALKHDMEASIQANIQAGRSMDQWGRSTVTLKKNLDDLDKKIDAATGATKKYDKAEQSVIGMMGEAHKKFIEQAGDLTNNQQLFNAIAGDMSNVFGSAVVAFESSQESMGKALERALAQYLMNLSGKAAADAIYFAAWGIADTFWDPPRAGGDFAAAAEFGVLAALTGAAGSAMNPGSGSSASSNKSTPQNGNGISGSSGTAGASPAPINVPHFATGGLISQPTLAVIGDSIHSSSQGAREAIMPLDDPKAMSAISEAITARQGGAGGGGVHLYFPNLKTMYNPGTTDELIDHINDRVAGGKHLLASEARKTVRRS